MAWLNKKQNICSTLFVKEKYAWKLACLVCTGLVLTQIFEDFFFDKPTVSSVDELDISYIQFPDLIICLQDGFDKTGLVEHGYNTSWNYFIGRDHLQNFIGWSGRDNIDPFRRDLNISFDFHFCNLFLLLLNPLTFRHFLFHMCSRIG